jgi:hypothetical protein
VLLLDPAGLAVMSLGQDYTWMKAVCEAQATLGKFLKGELGGYYE